MKTIKYVLGMTALVLCAALLLCGCGEAGQQPESTTAVYTVKVVDALGQPYTSGVIAQFMKDGQQVAMQVADGTGVASKELDKGDYTVALMFTSADASYYYDQTDLTLSAEKTEIEIVLAQTVIGEGVSLYADGAECTAWNVAAGCTHVELAAGRNYFLFTPAEAGTYEFSVIGSGTIGYYGAPHFVQSTSAAEVMDNAFSMSIKAEMIGTGNTGTSVYVVGIDAEAAGSTTLSIIRTGDPAWGVEDEEWTVYRTTAQLAPYSLPEGAKIGEFDLTAATDAYTLVYNETDGFYHMNTADGPLVLVRLGVKSTYLDPLNVVAEKSNVCKYFYDENGEFVKKETYNECLIEYFQYMDESKGLYPLTEDLKYIIQQRGDYYGWFDEMNQHGYLFRDDAGNLVPGINGEIAWLFVCCYIAE